MPTLSLIFVVYYTMIEVGKINLVWVGLENIYFVNVGSKVITSKKYNTKNIFVVEHGNDLRFNFNTTFDIICNIINNVIIVESQVSFLMIFSFFFQFRYRHS